MICESIHEGEALLVLLRNVSIQLLLQFQLALLIVVVLKSWLDVHARGDHCGDGPAEGVNFEEMHGAVESVELLGGKFGNERCQFLSDDVFDDVGLDLGRFLEFVVEGEENLEDELEGLLVDIGDLDLHERMITPPCSMALAYLMYCITASCFSVSS